MYNLPKLYMNLESFSFRTLSFDMLYAYFRAPCIICFLKHFIFFGIYVVDQMSLYFQGSSCLLDVNFSLIYRIYLHYVSLLCVRVPKHVSSETFPFLQSTFRFMLTVN